MDTALEVDADLARARTFEKDARLRLKPLTGRFAWPTVVLMCAVLAGLAAVAFLTVSGFLSYWVAIPINAILCYVIFTPLHEAVHSNIAGPNTRWRWLEELVGHISGFVLLAPFPGYRYLHLHHHQHTNDPVEDPDYWVKSNNYFMVILRCMAIQPMYIWHLWTIARDPVGMRAFVLEIAYVVSYPVIIFAAYQLGFGNELVLLWIVPGYIGVVLCPLMFDWPVHHPHSERGRYTDTAVLLFPKPLQRVMDVVFCGQTYHLIHHLYPRIPFYHYGTAYYALQNDLNALGAKVRDFR